MSTNPHTDEEEWYNTMSDSSGTYDSIADSVDYIVFHHHLPFTTTVNQHQIQCNNKSIAEKHPKYEACVLSLSMLLLKRPREPLKLQHNLQERLPMVYNKGGHSEVHSQL